MSVSITLSCAFSNKTTKERKEDAIGLVVEDERNLQGCFVRFGSRVEVDFARCGRRLSDHE